MGAARSAAALIRTASVTKNRKSKSRTTTMKNRVDFIQKHVRDGRTLRKRYIPGTSVLRDPDSIKRECERLGVAAPDSDELRVFKYQISDETTDRHGDIIRVDGWQTETFEKGGSTLYAHQSRELPVQDPLAVRVEDGALKAWAVEFERGLYDFADMVSDMVAKGYLEMTSVGMVPLEFEVQEGHEEEWFPPLEFTKQDLTEFSIVPAGSNRNAFVEGVSEEHQETLEEFSEKVLDGEVDVPNETENQLREAHKASDDTVISIAENLKKSLTD